MIPSHDPHKGNASGLKISSIQVSDYKSNNIKWVSVFRHFGNFGVGKV